MSTLTVPGSNRAWAIGAAVAAVILLLASVWYSNAAYGAGFAAVIAVGNWTAYRRARNVKS